MDQELDPPPAHPGQHYVNPGTKPLLGPAPPTDRGGVQRIVWGVFFLVVLGGLAVAIAMGLSGGSG